MIENLLSLLPTTESDDENGSMLADIIPALLPSLIGNPDTLQGIIRNTVEQYKPVVYAALGELLAAYEDLANNERLFNAQAKVKWSAHAAYTQAGFTSKQAMLLLLDSDLTRKRALKQIATTAAQAAAEA